MVILTYILIVYYFFCATARYNLKSINFLLLVRVCLLKIRRCCWFHNPLKALLYSVDTRTKGSVQVKDIGDSTQGILFVGTPHQGSSQAGWGSMLASLFGYVK